MLIDSKKNTEINPIIKEFVLNVNLNKEKDQLEYIKNKYAVLFDKMNEEIDSTKIDAAKVMNVKLDSLKLDTIDNSNNLKENVMIKDTLETIIDTSIINELNSNILDKNKESLSDTLMKINYQNIENNNLDSLEVGKEKIQLPE